MKISTLKQFLISGLICFGQQTFVQAQGIDSLKIIPENANAGDEIKVVCFSTFPTGGCDLMDYSVTFQGNQITLNLEHEPGMLTYICHSIDTISLGTLNAGDYDLHANLIIQPMDEIVDWHTTSFSIDSPLGFDDLTNTANPEVYPNPFDRELQIKADAIIESVEISSVSGQKIVLSENTGFNEKIIDLSDLKNGIYLLILTDINGNQYTKRIFKNTL